MKACHIPIILLFFGSMSPKSYAASSLPDSAEFKKIVHIIEQASQQFAPDKRTAILEWQLTDPDGPTIEITTTEPEAQQYISQSLAEQVTARAKVMINTLPDSSVQGIVTGIVTLSTANLRVAPSHQAELASQLLLGTQVDLLQRTDEYYRVRTPEGYIAWINTSSIMPMAADALQQWKAGKKVIFTADFGHAYTQPDATSLRVSDLVMGNLLVSIGESDGFVQVRYPDGRKGYVKTGEVQPFDAWLDTRDPNAENILATAKTMMGIPYLWGGTSVKGVDCSGFTKTAFYMNGLIIPRDASQQVLAGQPIDILSGDTLDVEKAIRNLEPGDLLFFAAGTNRPPDARVTHVALYLGNGEFIHSAGSVHVNSLLPDAPNYGALDTRTLIAARRYIGQTDPALLPIAQHAAYIPNQK